MTGRAAAGAVPQLPPGTQVVLRQALSATGGPQPGALAQRGAAGRVEAFTDDGRYRVRLVDGRAVLAGRQQVTLRRVHQRDIALGAVGADLPDGPELVRRHTILAVVVGSRAFGLARDDSDTDTRGVYAAPAAAFWSLVKPPAHVEGPGPEWFSWEVERFCELALKANPNLLEVLWSPLVVRRDPLGDELLGLREAFSSQLAHQTYNGYVLSQFTKIEADLRRDGVPRWKHVMHLIRLLLSGRELLGTGRPLVDVGPHRDRLLAVRSGEVGWDEVERWRLALHADLDAALERTSLPPAPDVAAVDGWLRSVRARSVRDTR